MKGYLEFDLPEESYFFETATKGHEIYGDLFRLQQELRSWIKHGQLEDFFADQELLAEWLNTQICEILSKVEE